jgi:serine/threonine protein kinase
MTQDPKAYQNIINEIEIQSMLKSPSVVALRNVTKTKGTFYLQLEFCNGNDLENYLKIRGGRLPEQEARIIIRQII